MNYELIKAAVAAVIKENGNEEITGNLLQQVLHSIINILGVGYQYMGMATPSTVPGTPDARQFYFAAQKGAYSNFNTSPITELDGRELAIFYYDTAWHVVMTGVATRDAMVGYAFYGEPLASGSVITEIDENTFFLVGPGTYTINGYSTTISTPGISALMYDVFNDELIDYTLLPYDTTPTEDSKNAITSGAVKTALDSKIDKVPDALTGEIPVFDGDGGLEGSNKLLSDLAMKEDIAVLAGEAGLAEAVIDTDGAGTEQQFTFRKSGGDGGAYYRKIKGKTIVVDAQLASNDAEAVETTGRNQYNPATGKAQVIGGTTYYIGGTYTSLSQGGVAITPAGDGTFTPASTGEVEVVGGNATDTIINISDADNGLWQPFWKRTLQLGITTRKDTDGNVPFADGMKGAGTAADWADKVGGEKVMGEVNLGGAGVSYSLWGYGEHIFATYSLASTVVSDNAICAKYTFMSVSGDNDIINGPDKTIYRKANGNIFIKDSAYSDAPTFKAAMSGVMLDHELATPVPFTWAEPLNLGVKVDENGTERAVAPEGATAPSAPFVADTTYTMSVARMVAKLNSI